MSLGRPVGPTPQALATLDLDTIERRLAAHTPDLAPSSRRRGWQAATAVVLAPGADGLGLTVIERATRAGDRWSGHMALPGGKHDPADPDLGTTARRETHEEVGLVLDAPVGRLADHHSRSRPGIVATFVFTLPEQRPLRPQPDEVADAWWMPMAALTDPARHTTLRRAGVPFPGIAHEGRTIWGLTLGTLSRFVRALDVDPSGDASEATAG